MRDFRRCARIFTLFVSFLTVGCATRYTLKPKSEKVEYLNGIPLETLRLPHCVVQTGHQVSTAEEMLVRLKVTNNADKAVEIDPISFTLNGDSEVVKGSPLAALNPDTYLKELSTSADLFQSRTSMDTYQGIDDLATVKTGTSDSEIDAAGRQYRAQKSEAENSAKSANDLRARIALIQTNAFRKTNVKAGETAEGALVFRTSFSGKGPVSIEFDHPLCGGKMNFDLSK